MIRRDCVAGWGARHFVPAPWPDTPPQIGFTPLMCAAKNDHLHVIELLLLHGARVEQCDRVRVPVTHRAATWRPTLAARLVCGFGRSDANAFPRTHHTRPADGVHGTARCGGRRTREGRSCAAGRWRSAGCARQRESAGTSVARGVAALPRAQRMHATRRRDACRTASPLSNVRFSIVGQTSLLSCSRGKGTRERLEITQQPIRGANSWRP